MPATMANHWARQSRSVVLLTFGSASDADFFEIDPRVERVHLDVVRLIWNPVKGFNMMRQVLVLRRALTRIAPDIAIFVKQLRAAGVDTPVMGTDGVDTGVTLTTGGAAVEGVTFTTFTFPTPGSAAEKFSKAFEEAYGDPPDGAYPELGYNAIAVMSAAVAKAGSTDPQKVAEALKGLEVEGATGSIKYPADGDHNP